MSQNNQEEFIYGEFAFESEQQTRAADAINSYLVGEGIIPEQLTRQDQFVPLNLENLVHAFDYAAEHIYKADIDRNAERIGQLEVRTEQLNTNVDNLAGKQEQIDKIQNTLALEQAEEEVERQNHILN